MGVTPRQRGRASLQFLGDLARFAGSELQPRSAAYLAEHAPSGGFATGDLARVRQATAILEESPVYEHDRLITRIVAEELYNVGFEAIDAVGDEVDAEYEEHAADGGVLELDPSLDPPAYWVPGFHLTPGGWDGHPKMGYLVHDFIYDYVFSVGGIGAVQSGKNLNDQRRQVAAQHRRPVERALEMGCGSGRFLLAAAAELPGAQLAGVDLAESSLRHAHLVAARHGCRWHLRQAACESTGFDDGSFDAVYCFTLFHEVPIPATKTIIEECRRVLAPGGELVIGDVAPYKVQRPYQAAIMDWETEHRGEPFWRASLVFDRVAALAEAGFEEIEEYGLGETNYPWITRGFKA